MYLFFGILLLILILFFFVNHFRKKKIIQKLSTMPPEEKCKELNNLIEPFGYTYLSVQNLFSTRIDARQRKFGYCTLYDRAAYHLNMNFDCLPVYFNYQEKTWLITFRKGQYGISTCGEIGVYYADRILEEKELTKTLFHSVENEDMIYLSLSLLIGDKVIGRLNGKHWWLTAFSMGHFNNPHDLTLYAALVFSNHGMAEAFIEGLIHTGFSPSDFNIYGNTVTLVFAHSPTLKGFFRLLQSKMGQWQNSFFCKLYLFITKSYDSSIDKLLYLYYYLPFAFHRMLPIRHYRKHRIQKHMREP